MSTATNNTKSYVDPVNDTLVDAKQVAKHFAVSVPTVWRWILSGKVASIKLGASRRTSLEAVARAFDSQVTEA